MARDHLPATARTAHEALTTLAWLWSVGWAALGVAAFVLLPPEGLARVGVQGASLWLGALVVLLLGGRVGSARAGTVVTVALLLPPLTLLLQLRSGLKDPWATATLATVLGIGALGLAVRTRWSVPLGATLALLLVATRIAILSSLSVRTGDNTFSPRGIATADIVVPGLAAGLTLLLTVSVRRLLVRSIRLLETSRAALTAQRLRLGVALARDHELVHEQSLLHDTALNTLGVLGRGESGRIDRDKLRARCRTDAVRLRDWLTGVGAADAGDLAAHVALRAELLGLSVELDEDTLRRAQDEADPDTVAVVVRVIDEGLLNVSKHSRGDHAQLQVGVEPEVLLVQVIDEGGRAPGARRPTHVGHGLASLRAAVAAVGGQLDLTVGQTRSALTVQLPRGRGPAKATPTNAASTVSSDLADEVNERLVDNLATYASALAVLWSIGGLATVLWSSDSYDATWLQAASILVVGGWSCLQWLARRSRQPVSAGDVLVTAALVVLAQLAAAVSDPSCSAAVDHAVPLDATTVLVLATCLARPARAVVVSCLSALLGGAVLSQLVWSRSWHGCGPSVVLGAAASALLVLLLLHFALALRRQMGAAHEVEDSSARTAEQVARAEAVALTRREWFEPVVGLTLPLLEAVAEGRRSADDEELREDCRRDAAFLRALISVPPDDREVSDVVRRLVLRTRSRGYGMVIRGSVARFAPSTDELAHLAADWDQLVAGAQGGESAVLLLEDGSSSLFIPGAAIDTQTASALSAAFQMAPTSMRRTLDLDDGVRYVSEPASPPSNPSSLARM